VFIGSGLSRGEIKAEACCLAKESLAGKVEESQCIAHRKQRVSAWPSGTVSGFLLSADFRRLVLSILYLPSSASSADSLFGF
jgi:hypothetical protein